MKSTLAEFNFTSKIISIRSLFPIDGSKSVINDAVYQRKFMWPETKSSNFIETLLLYGEMTPIIIYSSSKNNEIIDGKQRAEAISRFTKGKLKLKANGLSRLWHLAGKVYSELPPQLQERLFNIKIRCIWVTPKNEDTISEEVIDKVKRELFKRYNMGISPLKKEESAKALYMQENINTYFKKQFQIQPEIYMQIVHLFRVKRNQNLESIMKTVRELLVLHNIPINKYSHERDEVVSKYYDLLSFQVEKLNDPAYIPNLYDNFMSKINYLLDIKKMISELASPPALKAFECLYWAISVCEKQGVSLEMLDNPQFKTRLIQHLIKQADSYSFELSHLSGKIIRRHELISSFFISQLNISFTGHLKSDPNFLLSHKQKISNYLTERFSTELDDICFRHATGTTYTIRDITHKMQRQVFFLRPSYQRDEVMNLQKASSLIESILFGVKLNPIFVFIRKDGIHEVIDGQQRLLSILGFIGEAYLTENKKIEFPKKRDFTLRLTNEIGASLHGKRFEHLTEDQKKKLWEFDLEVIEIKETEDTYFIPEDFFHRINSKPLPIEQDSFEYWNAYADTDITTTIKSLNDENKWLYLRKDNRRMQNETLITNLCYLECMANMCENNLLLMKDTFDICKARFGVTVRLRKKSHVTEVLLNPAFKFDFLQAINNFETDFIKKVRLLITGSNPTSDIVISRRFDKLLQVKNNRVSMNFYILWCILKQTPIDVISEKRATVLSKIDHVFLLMSNAETADQIESILLNMKVLSHPPLLPLG
jgi:uncharacterized protein with ParB-like and HNH nuclease domain